MSAYAPRPHWTRQPLWDALRTVMGRPPSAPPENYTRRIRAELDISAAVVLNGTGAGFVPFMPDGMTVWDVRQVQLTTTSGPTDGSQAMGYTDGVFPHRQVFQTAQAGGDSFAFSRRVRPGSTLIIVWSGERRGHRHRQPRRHPARAGRGMTMPGGRSFGMAPSVPNVTSGESILQPPSVAAFYTFTAAGRIWGATVSYAMGSSGGTGSNQGYARVRIQGSTTLAIVECCVVGAPSADSNTSDQSYNGIPVPKGTKIQLDVNNNVTIAGVVQRASGLVVVSMP